MTYFTSISEFTHLARCPKVPVQIKNYLHGIVASAVHPLHTCRLEGMNNKIKLLKRMGYGYRDTEYFFLKVREAFPGDPR
nr:transposase [Shewanella algae]